MNSSGHIMMSLLVCLALLHGTHCTIELTPNDPVKPQVAEDAEDGTEVFTQAVTGATGDVTYSLVGTSDEFAIDGSGVVTVKTGASLDYETTTEYEIVIQAEDTAPSSASTTVTIVVNDVNDNSPTYGTAPPTPQSICTTATSGTIGTYTATDADGTAAHNTITYSISAGDDSPAKFNMNPTTAVITKTPIPFQTNKTVYDLVLQAVNTGAPTPTATTNLMISVTDAACNKASVLSGGLIAMATILLSALLKLSL